jgi:hypothetical protein
MTPEQAWLKRGLARLWRGFPSTFTVEGLHGEFACVYNAASYAVEPSVSGARTERVMTISFDRSIPYKPVSGDIITVDGQPWRVSNPLPAHTKWDVNLISVDE